MTDYPKPPFDTTETWIVDTFNPEEGARKDVVDYNKLTNEELGEIYYLSPIAKALLDWREENGVKDPVDESKYEEDQKG